MAETKTKPQETLDTNAPRSGELVTIAPTSQGRSVLNDMAARYGMEPTPFEQTVRAIAMPMQHTREQFAAFLLIAKEYKLNPLTREIYAFPARGGGIVPVVSIDGWVSLINMHPQCDGFDFKWEQTEAGDPISCTCTMYRKDRAHPVEVTEYFAECVRATDPWKMKHRMLRHKALIQAGRYAFGFAGIYDVDEGEAIAAARDVSIDALPSPEEPLPDPEEPTAGQPLHNSDHPEGAESEAAPDPLIDALAERFAKAQDAEAIEEAWSELDVESECSKSPERMERAMQMKRQALASVGAAAPDDGQDDMFPGDRP